MSAIRCIGASLLAAALATPARAQVASKKVLTLEGARAVADRAAAEARRNGSPGVIAVVDDGGNLVYLERLENTFPAGARISTGKARTAALFRRPTKAFEEIVRNGRTAMVALDDFTPLQGGEPIVVDGAIVGAIGVSGATDADMDERIALAGAGALGASTAAKQDLTAPAVLYYGAAQVARSFARGGVLVDGEGGRNYMVHTSRRDADGMAELHALDTDIIYVTRGSAMLVTGGTVVGGKPTAPDEIRGTGIEGGEPRRLSEGDVIIVPNGTPHQFRDVRAPFTYYTVKVR